MWLWLYYPTISLCWLGITILETAFIETTSVHITAHYGTAGTCRYLQVQIFILSKLVGYRNMVSVAPWKRWKHKTLWHFQIQIQNSIYKRAQNSIYKVEFWKRSHNLLSCFLLIYIVIVWIYIFINFWWKVMHSLMWNYKMSQFVKLLQWNFIFIHEIDPPFHFTPPKNKG